MVDKVAQRGYGASTLEDTENSMGQGAGQPALDGTA